MRTRTIREGSVGLLILFGIGLFVGLVLWLRGFNPTSRPYRLIAEFEDTMGVQLGTPVLYRGVSVGRVVKIDAGANKVDLEIEIIQKDLLIPNEVTIETVESGLIGEISIEITPLAKLSASAAQFSPTGKNCNSEVILCDGDRLIGQVGPSYEAVLRSAGEVADLLADPELIAQLKTVLSSVTQTANEAGTLAQAATALTRSAQVEIDPLSNSAQSATDSVALAAQQFSLTATDINSLIGENRGTLVDSLGNVQAASLQLRNAADVLGPRLQSGELVNSLEVLIGNATAASSDLRSITTSLNNPTNLVLLQQTLESARDALASAQKVMADVDEITGDPAIREQLRNLINGLGGLVSSTRSLEQQSEVAQVLAPLGERARLESLSQVAPQTTREDAAAALLAGDRPVLVFDGDRYILKPADQLAENRRDKAPVKGSTALPKIAR